MKTIAAVREVPAQDLPRCAVPAQSERFGFRHSTAYFPVTPGFRTPERAAEDVVEEP